MAYTRDNYKSQMLWNEGFVLQHAAQNGMDAGAGVSRATIDGCINGMVRLERPSTTATFLFGVTDRVVAGIRAETPVGIAGIKIAASDSVAAPQVRPDPLPPWRKAMAISAQWWPLVATIAFIAGWIAARQ